MNDKTAQKQPRPRWQRILIRVIAYPAGLFVVLMILVGIFGDRKSRQKPGQATAEAAAPDEPEAPKWWEGGTLHKATAGDWRSGSARDRLATAADWALASDKIRKSVEQAPRALGMEPLRGPARELVDCINTATNKETDGRVIPDGTDLPTLVTMCSVMMGWAD